ncbi:hypothetical protein ACFVVM_01280 [Nocardia sp. NPDC058176]|uniref:hypothetical protein n=1 Tax=Nocardia sp. NPDC058176 TaxID=3346368 RepID=UPI0036DC748E
MIFSTPPALADPVAADALRRRWPRVAGYLRISYLVLPIVVAVASTVTLALVVPVSIRGWALPLHVLLISAPPVLALVRLRRSGVWPPRRWTVGNGSAAAQFVVLAVEVGVMLYFWSPGVTIYGVVVGVGVVCIVTAVIGASPALAGAAVASSLVLGLVLPDSVPGWVTVLHILVLTVPFIVILRELRPGERWPPRQWAVGNLTVVALSVVMVLEIAVMLHARGATAHVIVAGVGLLVLIAAKALNDGAVARVGDIDRLSQAESNDTLPLQEPRLGTPPGIVLLEPDAIAWRQHHWEAVQLRLRMAPILPDEVDPFRGGLKISYIGSSILGEVRFEEIHAVWPTVRPVEEPPYIWLVPADQPPEFTSTRQTLVVQPKAPGRSLIRIPVRDAEVAAALVRRRMRWQEMKSNRYRPNHGESRYSR